jgi:phage-related protein
LYLVNKFDNIDHVTWSYHFFDADVRTAMLALDAYQLADLKQAKDILTEFGPHELPVKLSRPLGDGLFEFKLRGEDTTARVFYCFFSGQRLVFLHSFIKKTQKTPDAEMKTARKKMSEAQVQEKGRLREEATKAAQAKKEGKNARRQ